MIDPPPHQQLSTTGLDNNPKLRQAFEQLSRQPEYQEYLKLIQEFDDANNVCENAWAAFLETNEGRHFNESNQRYQRAEDHYQQAKAKASATDHYQNYMAAISQQADTSKLVDQANTQADTDPEYKKTAEYHEVTSRHRKIIALCRAAWRDLSHVIEGRAYQRAKAQIELAKMEVDRAWNKCSRTFEGQKLSQMMEYLSKLRASCRQAEQNYQQTAAYTEYKAAGG